MQIILSCSVLFSSEQVVDFDYQPEQKISLVCVLNPDSLVQLSLYYTRALDDNTAFVPVEDARVVFYEDGQEWGTATYEQNGTYRLDNSPAIGKTYRLIADIADHLPLSAITIVPERPDVDTTIVSKTPYRFWNDHDPNTQFYFLEVEYRIDDQPGKNYYWNGFFHQISCMSPYADNFNREIDTEAQFGFYYHFYVRQTDDGVDGETMKFKKRLNTRMIDVFFNTDEHYDKYMKSSIQSWLIEEWEDLPFKEPVQIYSNIENGTGIFGSASFTYLSFRNE